jgi:UDP-2,3-diacylglucosamine pyrophosphatase LpxH
MANRKTHIFVISDLHLGGAPATKDKPAFQICTEAGRAQLARFIVWATGRYNEGWDVQLVIAGDIVDFLAEERSGGFSPFTNDDAQARDKLAHIMRDTAEVWKELRNFVARGGSLILMLGNHDLELSLPAPRRLLLETLGPGRVEFIYDNQAFSRGRVLIEHGNRYDDWNAVPHDELREARSRLSRGEKIEFDPLPGSRMVVELVNPAKAELAFVDLLKPEDAALLPFLALLAPDRFHQAVTTLKNRVRAMRVKYGPGQQPKDRNFVGLETAEGAVAEAGTGDAADDALLALAEEAAGDGAMVSSGGSFLERWRGKLGDAYRQKQLDLLHKVLRAYRGSHERAFDVAAEDEKYLKAATETAAHEFDVIVYGHTHLPKRVPLAGRKTGAGITYAGPAVYFNSGTWADLMAVPSDLLAADGVAEAKGARERLEKFADDLALNRVDSWRRLLPTFVRIDLDEDDRVTDAALELLVDGERPVAVTSEMVRGRLEGALK